MKSTVCATEVVVVRAPGDAIDLRCGGHPLAASDASTPPGLSIVAPFDTGTQLGKRYADEDAGVELLCTKAGDGALSIGDVVLAMKGAKPLPASD